MTRSWSLRAYIGEALAAHRVIDANVERLVARAAAEDLDLSCGLTELRELLLRHFEAEEQSEMFGAIRELLPNIGAQVDDLVAEHREIERVLKMAAERLAARAVPAAEVHQALDLLRRLLASHERAEAELMSSALAALA